MPNKLVWFPIRKETTSEGDFASLRLKVSSFILNPNFNRL